MKSNSTPFSATVGAVCAAGVLFVTTGHADNGPFDLSWATIAGGGGKSSGGQFALNGTVGQANTGTLTGGNYTLEAGFWSGITVEQTPGAPILRIQRLDNGQVLISWPVNVTGFSLEERAGLGPGGWSAT